MLNLKKYYVRIAPALGEFDTNLGSYCQRYVDAVGLWDAETQVKTEFGPGWLVIESYGPIDNLELRQ